MTILRSLLFVPGNQPRMLEKAMGLGPDALVPDLEDSVPAAEKAKARELVASYLPRLSKTARLLIPRVNCLETAQFTDDLSALVGPDIFGISVGKIRSDREMAEVSDMVETLERERGLETGIIKLVPWIESASALVNAYAICAASPRTVAVAFGAEDYANDMGIERTSGGSELAYARGVVGVAARAAGVLALDTPFFGLRDLHGLRQDALTGKRYGFRGKFAVHPSQIGVINETFTPSPSEIERAQRIVAAYEKAESAGRGSIALDGVVIDVPVVERARELLALAASLLPAPSEKG